jgi:hypothetical protein
LGSRVVDRRPVLGAEGGHGDVEDRCAVPQAEHPVGEPGHELDLVEAAHHGEAV